jgi:hypothetical protein
MNLSITIIPTISTARAADIATDPDLIPSRRTWLYKYEQGVVDKQTVAAASLLDLANAYMRIAHVRGYVNMTHIPVRHIDSDLRSLPVWADWADTINGIVAQDGDSRREIDGAALHAAVTAIIEQGVTQFDPADIAALRDGALEPGAGT